MVVILHMYSFNEHVVLHVHTHVHVYTTIVALHVSIATDWLSASSVNKTYLVYISSHHTNDNDMHAWV